MLNGKGWEDLRLQRSISASPSSTSSSPTSTEDLERGVSDVGIGFVGGGRRSHSYHRLPAPVLRLSVLKLDGSSFEVMVAASASVVELKAAVEDVFSKSRDQSGIEISWSHVWGNFCLGYGRHMLINDRTSLRSLGIKDGDQLHFMRCPSVDHDLSKKNVRPNGAFPPQRRRSLTALDTLEETKEMFKSRSTESLYVSADEENSYHDDEDDDRLPTNREYTYTSSSLGWFSYFRLTSWGAWTKKMQ